MSRFQSSCLASAQQPGSKRTNADPIYRSLSCNNLFAAIKTIKTSSVLLFALLSLFRLKVCIIAKYTWRVFVVSTSAWCRPDPPYHGAGREKERDDQPASCSSWDLYLPSRHWGLLILISKERNKINVKICNIKSILYLKVPFWPQ